jgi:hypothetical protein
VRLKRLLPVIDCASQGRPPSLDSNRRQRKVGA